MPDTLERFMFASVRHGSIEFHICVRGPRACIEFHFVAIKDRKMCFDQEAFPLMSLGVEIHRLVETDKANRPKCHLLHDQPCYHDGTSLWASEYVMPRFMDGGSEEVYWILEKRYLDEFSDTKDPQ